MMRAILAACFSAFGLLAACAAQTKDTYLVIVASSDDPAAIALSAKSLRDKIPDALTIKTSDCGDSKDVFAVAARVESTLAGARRAVRELKTIVADAYIKPCQIQRGSLLDMKIQAIDSSIAIVPEDVVNWTDADRVSQAYPFASGSLLVRNMYVPSPDDALEGQHSEIIWVGSDRVQRPLTSDCLSADHVSVRGRWIAFSCAREQAADNVMHSVEIYSVTGDHKISMERCREPEWTSDILLSCNNESVDASGTLILSKQTLAPLS